MAGQAVMDYGPRLILSYKAEKFQQADHIDAYQVAHGREEIAVVLIYQKFGGP